MSGIVIRKENDTVKFFLSDKHTEPAAVVYEIQRICIIRDDMVKSKEQADGLAEVMSIVGMFIHSLNTSKDSLKKKVFDVEYRMYPYGNERHNQRYNARQILKWVESNNIVTINKVDKIKYQFVDFNFDSRKLIINYKPVIW